MCIQLCGISKISNLSTSIFVENSEEKLGIGSGIIVTSNGYILANASIVGEVGANCYVTLKNGESYVAEVVWCDSNMDIAIIKIATENLIALGIGDSNNVNLGQDVYMISNPTGVGVNQSLAIGTISETNKTFKVEEKYPYYAYIEDVIKLDFEITSNQTGSPILNSDSELIGIASYKLGCVIPINRVKNIISKLEEDESFEEAYLGIYGFDYDAIKILNSENSLNYGVYIEQIDDESPVKDKILSGDILLEIDENKLSKMQDLTEYIYTKNPGDIVKLILLRDNQQIELEVELLEK